MSYGARAVLQARVSWEFRHFVASVVFLGTLLFLLLGFLIPTSYEATTTVVPPGQFSIELPQISEFEGKFRTAVELIRNGRIGKVKTIRIGVGAPNRPCDLPEKETPEGTDWDTWLGGAPKRPLDPLLARWLIRKATPSRGLR